MTKSEWLHETEDSFVLDEETPLVREQSESEPVYDLEERTARFGETVINFAKKIARGPLADRIIDQLVGAGTSVGANYIEADDSGSKKEFLKSIGTCNKESRETKHFLRMAAPAVPELQDDARKLWMEARALHLIFARIWRAGKQTEK